MLILAYDPGESTGFCKLEFSRFRNEVTDVFTTTFRRGESYLSPIDFVDVVLIEKPPAMSPIGSDVHLVYTQLLKFYHWVNVESIFPSQWKPVANARKWKSSVAKTPHERDALFLARWYIFRTYREDIGDI